MKEPRICEVVKIPFRHIVETRHSPFIPSHPFNGLLRLGYDLISGIQELCFKNPLSME
jgi:hypothetical protein